MFTELLYQRYTQLLQRLHAYHHDQVVIELVIIWIVVFLVLNILRGTRGARVIKWMAFFLIAATLVVSVLEREQKFERLTFLYDHFMWFFALAMVIAFQPEFRRALVRLGDTRFLRWGGRRLARVIDEIVQAAAYMSKNKIGALVAIERQNSLEAIAEAGTRLDALVTHELLNTLFWPGSALHDMGVVIRGDQIAAAGVQFPLAVDQRFDTELGSRHRAAIGLSQEVDALVVIVSEETGIISLAMGGKLTRNLTPDELRTRLMRGLGQSGPPELPAEPPEQSPEPVPEPTPQPGSAKGDAR